MYIYPKNTGPVRPDSVSPSSNVSPSDPVQPTGVGSPSSGSTAERSDKVEISDAGRALAARGTAAADESSLDPARAASIRGRILGGAYNTLDVVDAVARRILDSGDL
jgi:hypothetical protein